jgi:type IV pilus assembly protein PilF
MTAINTVLQAADCNLQLGLAYLQAGNRLRAKEKLFEAERQNPNAAYIKSAIAYFWESTGEWEKSEFYHLQALQLDKHGGATHNNYGRFLCQCARYNKAEAHFLKATKDLHYANTASAYENAGLCAMRIPDVPKAMGYLHKALSHNPRLEKSWLALAQLEKQPKLAYEYLKRYQAITARNTPAALALGVELAQHLNEIQSARLYALVLKAKYPESLEYEKIISAYPKLITDE